MTTKESINESSARLQRGSGSAIFRRRVNSSSRATFAKPGSPQVLQSNPLATSSVLSQSPCSFDDPLNVSVGGVFFFFSFSFFLFFFFKNFFLLSSLLFLCRQDHRQEDAKVRSAFTHGICVFFIHRYLGQMVKNLGLLHLWLLHCATNRSHWFNSKHSLLIHRDCNHNNNSHRHLQ